MALTLIGAKTDASTVAAPIHLRLSRDRLYVFAALAAIEQRPVGEVAAECLADMAIHLCCQRSPLILDGEDATLVKAYLAGLELLEREDV